MSLTNGTLTGWELAHQMAGIDPDTRHLFGLPLAVKNNLRLLVNEILEGNLPCISLSLEKWQAGSDMGPEFYIRHHLDKIHRCIDGLGCDRELMKFILIDRYDFERWCERSGHPKPEFWYSCNWQWIEENDLDGDSQSAPPKGLDNKLRANQQTRIACQTIAANLWKDNPEMTIAAMVQHEVIQKWGGANHYEPDTVRGWLKEIAPDDVRARRGRPKKQEQEGS